MPVSTSHWPVPSRLTVTDTEVSRVLREMEAQRDAGREGAEKGFEVEGEGSEGIGDEEGIGLGEVVAHA